jgi:hypothetical protein
MAPDYSHQLDAIARALSQPSTPAWLIAVLSALLGLIGGLLAQPLLLLIKEVFDRHRMRLVLYRELSDLFSIVDSVMSFKELPVSDLHRWQESQLRELMSFEGEKYLRQKPDLYMQLPERFAADACYRHLHRILDEISWLHVNTGLARAVFADAVVKHDLEPERLRYFLGEERANRVIRRAREINDEQTAMRERMNVPNRSSDDEGR